MCECINVCEGVENVLSLGTYACLGCWLMCLTDVAALNVQESCGHRLTKNPGVKGGGHLEVVRNLVDVAFLDTNIFCFQAALAARRQTNDS